MLGTKLPVSAVPIFQGDWHPLITFLLAWMTLSTRTGEQLRLLQIFSGSALALTISRTIFLFISWTYSLLQPTMTVISSILLLPLIRFLILWSRLDLMAVGE